MTAMRWSVVLQWSRLAVNAGVFLIAARFLPLAEIGAFAAAFAVIRLMQAVHKAGVAELAIIADPAPSVQAALFRLSLLLGAGLSVVAVAIAPLLPEASEPLLLALACLPVVHGVSAVSEGHLRRDLRLRALALRTLAVQLVAAAVAAVGFHAGWGAWALVAFALVNGALTGLLSVVMAPVRDIRTSSPGAMRAMLPDLARLALRDLAGGAVQPLLQIAVAMGLGLGAAGAFQIAARMLSLLDALALSPLRYVALPRFAALSRAERAPALMTSLRQAAVIGVLVYLGASAVAPELLRLVIGAQHAPAVAPLLLPFCVLGLISALLMPVTQALIAAGRTGLPLRRAGLTMVLSLALALPATALSVEAVALSLPLASVLAAVPYLKRALPALDLSPASFLGAIAPALLAGLAMSLGLSLADQAFASLPTMLRLGAEAALGAAFFAAILSMLSARRGWGEAS